MRRVRVKWFLPIVQLLLALAAYVYGPAQYKAILDRSGVMGDNNVMEYSAQNSPAPIERLSLGINFPAIALDCPLWRFGNQIWLYRGGRIIFFEITPRGVGFFFGVVVFWYWVGRKFDECRGNPRIARPSGVRMAWLWGGLAFGIVTGACAVFIYVVDGFFRPERQVAYAGIAWSFALIAYFAWQLTRAWSKGTETLSKRFVQ
jgi:hypothetical protein